MAKATDFSPFPPLKWDGWCWRGVWAVPWFPKPGKVNLIVFTPCWRSGERTKAEIAPAPTSAQAAAFQLLLSPQSPVQEMLLATFRKHLPELADGDWEASQELLELADVIVFHTAVDEMAYTGFVLNSMEYEHGVGIVAHGARLAHIGNAEEADEAAAEKDLRRLKRARRQGTKPG